MPQVNIPLRALSWSNRKVIKNPLITKKKCTPTLPILNKTRVVGSNAFGNPGVREECASKTNPMLTARQPFSDGNLSQAFTFMLKNPDATT